MFKRIGSKLSFPIQMVILLSLLSFTVAVATSVTLSDGEWIGLGASAGRLEVDDLATDELLVKDAHLKLDYDLYVNGADVFVGQNDSAKGLVKMYGAGAGVYGGGAAQFYVSADYDAAFNAFVIDAAGDDLRFYPDTAAWIHYFKDDGDVLFDAGLETGSFRFEDESLTISSGSVTLTNSYIFVSAEGESADDLDTILGGTDGMILVVRVAGCCTVTLKDVTSGPTGRLSLNGDFGLTHEDDTITLLYHASRSQWVELSRSDNR